MQAKSEPLKMPLTGNCNFSIFAHPAFQVKTQIERLPGLKQI
jgi:hypothetical protein